MPPLKADEDAAKAGLADVIANAEHERLPVQATSVCERRGDGGRGCVEQNEVFCKGGGLRGHVTLGREGERGAVEEEAIVAADLVDHGDRNAVTLCEGGEHAAPGGLLAAPEGRCGEVEHDARCATVGRALRHQALHWIVRVQAVGPETLVVPCVFADSYCQNLVVELDERLGVAGLEVALLVEDVVERQKNLLLQEQDLAPSHRTATLRACLPGRVAEGKTVPKRMAGIHGAALASTICCIAASAAARKSCFSMRSAGG